MNSKFPHGLMFHHFHDNKKHLKSQGSITRLQLSKIIKFVGVKNILTPEDFSEKLQKKKLNKNDKCITFDDSLLCQYDIALPVLEDFNLKAFFFVTTSVFSSKPDNLEVYRYFRVNCYQNLDDFYKAFFSILSSKIKNKINYFIKKISYYKKNFKFYSHNDILFRIYRDFILNDKEYDSLMFRLFKSKNFNPKKHYQKLFLSKKNVVKISNLGHSIGLHSHTHPTDLKKLQYLEQYQEYNKNLKYLNNVLKNKKKIYSMSHPCGSYDSKTLNILTKMNIDIGFLALMQNTYNKKKNNLIIPRQDHSNLIKFI